MQSMNRAAHTLGGNRCGTIYQFMKPVFVQFAVSQCKSSINLWHNLRNTVLLSVWTHTPTPHKSTKSAKIFTFETFLFLHCFLNTHHTVSRTSLSSWWLLHGNHGWTHNSSHIYYCKPGRSPCKSERFWKKNIPVWLRLLLSQLILAGFYLQSDFNST